MQTEVRAITSDTRADFFRIHCSTNGEGWCNCVAWWVPTWDDWGSRTEHQNRNLRDQLFDQGQYDGYILYADDEPVAWRQCGPRDRLEKLCRQYNLEPSEETWALTCFVVISSWRGKGISHQLLAGVLTDLERKGVRHVQGFPKCAADLDAGHVWTGPESVFQKAGFVVERDHPQWPIYGKRLQHM